MKKPTRLLLAAFVAGLAAGRVSFHSSAEAEDPVAASDACGETNGDGKLDIADAVYLLQYLFLSGPELACPEVDERLSECEEQVELLESELARRRLPATGQAKCTDALGNVIPCDSIEFPGQDGVYRAGCPLESRYILEADGTVTDTCTGLMWQEDTADVNGDGKADAADAVTWQDALKYAESLILCADGTWTTDPDAVAQHGGVKHDDWRLPNITELGSIVDRGRPEPILPPIFKGGDTACYWSSTSVDFSPRNAWYFFFRSSCQPADKTGALHVRAVRDSEGA